MASGKPRVQTTGRFHHRVSGRTEWLTPKWLLDAIGPFDLDPCASVVRPWPVAKLHYTEGGLDRPWKGMVYLNPPYGRSSNEKAWLAKLADHGEGIALVYARTEISQWQEVIWPRASAIHFLGTSKIGTSGRIQFCNTDGSTSPYHFAGSSLVAFGDRARRRLQRSGLAGYIVTVWEKSG